MTRPDRAGSRLRVRRSLAGSFRLSVASGAAIVALLAARPARAGDNDLLLWTLGNPDSMITCTICDGSDNTRVAGDPLAQTRFARMTAALGLAFVPGFGETAASIGQAGFEIGFTQSARILSINANEWATDGSWNASSPALPQAQQFSQPPGALMLSSLTIRKGIGGSFDIGAFATYLAESQMFALGAEVRGALIDGIDYAPDLSIRAWGARVVGTRELDLTMAGADAMLSKSFGVSGSVKLQPYGQFGVVLINATSGVIDFNPAHQDLKNPTSADGVFGDIHMLENRYNRAAAGLRIVAGAAVIGLEGDYAFGTSPVQHNALPASGGVVPPTPTQTTHQIGIDAHLGLQF